MRQLMTVTALLFFAITFQVDAQDKVRLDENLEFNEGIYMTVSDFLNNRAIDPAKITAVHSSTAVRRYDISKKQRSRGLSWGFFGELVYSATSSISVDSISVELDDSGFETLIPGHNFFGIKINDRLYLNISPHQRPSLKGKPIFGRVAFTGRLMVLYVDHDFDSDTQYYVSDESGNVVRDAGMQETVRTIVIFDVIENRFEFANERAFGKKLESDKDVQDRYYADKKRKKRIPYYADLFNQRNPVYLP